MLHIDRLMLSIENLGKHSIQQSFNRQNDLATVTAWLHANTSTEALVEKLDVMIRNAPHCPGAIPCTNHPLDTVFSQSGSYSENVTVIGVDGSQIYPDRHSAVIYYLIQCGALIYRYDGGIPKPRSIEKLCYEDRELYDKHGFLIGIDEIGIKRTIQEMQFIADICSEQASIYTQAHTFALIDGPLLWPHPEHEASPNSEFNAYINAFKEIQQSGAVPVGYIDRPSGKWFVTTLWMNQDPDRFSLPDESFPLYALNDAQLMTFLLSPGECTPFYKRHSRVQTLHSHFEQEIWFCYMNLGNADKPNIARIEIPKWFAHDGDTFSMLHKVLLHQAQVLNGYPYVLARAHEQALITTQDKLALDHLLERKLMEQGVVPRISEKARQKSYLGQG